MVFQNVYLFHDTIRANICFGKPDATEEEMTATASIDPENEHLIQAAISELTRGKTIITIAHRLATVRNADQILVVDDGRIAEHGTHDELIKQNGIYKRFTEIREKAEGWHLADN